VSEAVSFGLDSVSSCGDTGRLRSADDHAADHDDDPLVLMLSEFLSPCRRSRFTLALLLFALLLAGCDDEGASTDVAQDAPTDVRADVQRDAAADGADDTGDDGGADVAVDADASADAADTRDTTSGGLDIPFDIKYEDTRGVDADGVASDADAVETDVADADASDAGVELDPEGPNGPTPFDDLYQLRGGQMRLALHDRVDNHTSLGYNAAREAMYDELNGIDVNDGQIECYYTGNMTAPDGTRAPGNFNTEHSWPRSRGADMEPAESDIHHLFPATSISNQARAAYLYGETPCDQSTSCDWFGGGSELGPSVIDASTVFEVRPERRGDIARAQFYFAVRYSMDIEEDVETFLREWNDSDPVDALELDRNDRIEAVQSNRNPFVDRPDYVQVIDF